jgi:hypothetical protein
MKLKFSEQLIEPRVRRLHALYDVAFYSSGTLRSITLATILPGVPPERTDLLLHGGVPGRGDFANRPLSRI